MATRVNVSSRPVEKRRASSRVPTCSDRPRRPTQSRESSARGSDQRRGPSRIGAPRGRVPCRAGVPVAAIELVTGRVSETKASTTPRPRSFAPLPAVEPRLRIRTRGAPDRPADVDENAADLRPHGRGGSDRASLFSAAARPRRRREPAIGANCSSFARARHRPQTNVVATEWRACLTPASCANPRRDEGHLPEGAAGSRNSARRRLRAAATPACPLSRPRRC